MPKPTEHDISIYGQGFYTLAGDSDAGKEWMERNVMDYDTAVSVAYSDDTRITQDIADGACLAGLAVTVNGRVYHA